MTKEQIPCGGEKQCQDQDKLAHKAKIGARQGWEIVIVRLLDIIEKSGAWFYYDGERLGQGKENVRKLIEGNAELMNKLEALVREKAKSELFEEDGEIGGDDDDDFDIEDFGEEE